VAQRVGSEASQEWADLHDRVVRASLSSYTAVGQRGMPFWERGEDRGTFPDLLLPGLRRVEEIETEQTLDNLDERRIAQLRRLGLELWILVPLSRIADAHERLRGLVDRLQPWWISDERIAFGQPRIP
jgi:hypothetical protein